jgi:hypothetical protein
MPTNPTPAGKEPAEGSREVIDSELARTSGKQERSPTAQPASPQQIDSRPGDEAPAGTPGTGEDICPRCHGAGRVEGKSCPNCSGTGRVIKAIGGA